MTTISLKTSIPGPKSQALLARRKEVAPQGPFNLAPIFIKRGDGATVTDVDGNVLRNRALEWQNKHPMIGDIRRLGAMVAVEFVKDRKTKEPAKEFNVALVKRCVESGVILIYAGTHSNVLRYLVSLVITDAQLDEGLDVIERQLKA